MWGWGKERPDKRPRRDRCCCRVGLVKNMASQVWPFIPRPQAFRGQKLRSLDVEGFVAVVATRRDHLHAEAQADVARGTPNAQRHRCKKILGKLINYDGRSGCWANGVEETSDTNNKMRGE